MVWPFGFARATNLVSGIRTPISPERTKQSFHKVPQNWWGVQIQDVWVNGTRMHFVKAFFQLENGYENGTAKCKMSPPTHSIQLLFLIVTVR